MEKRTAHSKLAVVKALVEAGKVRTTHAARSGANELGLAFSEMLDVVMALAPADFLQKHDDPCRSCGLAGRLPAQHARG